MAAVSVDDFLKTQATQASRFRGTIELVPETDQVRITPVLTDGRCPCGVGLNIPKRLIASVSPTDATRHCCGKVLRVADVEFTAEGAILEAVFAQLIARATAASRSDHEHADDSANLPLPRGPSEPWIRPPRCDFYECMPTCYQSCQNIEPGTQRLLCIRSCWLQCCH